MAGGTQCVFGVAHVAHRAAFLGIDRQARGRRHRRHGLGQHPGEAGAPFGARGSVAGGHRHVGKQHRGDEAAGLGSRHAQRQRGFERRLDRPLATGGRRQAGPAKSGHILRAGALVGLEGPVDGVEQPDPEHRHVANARRRRHAVLAQAGQGLQRQPAGHHPVHHAGQRVEVSPWPLLAVAVVLLGRCKARAHHGGEGLVHGVVLDAPGRAEIQQHRRAVGTHVDVAGLHVAMQKTGPVHNLQPVEQRADDAQQACPVEGQAPHQPVLQRLAGFVLHHHVGGVVGAEVAQHAHDAGMVKARQRAGFEQEALQPPVEGLLDVGRAGPHAQLGGAHRHVAGQVFLDRHAAIQVGVVGQVRHAKTATAQHPLEAVLVEGVAAGQRERVVLMRGRRAGWVRHGVQARISCRSSAWLFRDFGACG